jgi:hypothetical protein
MVLRGDDVEQMMKAKEAKILPSSEEPHNNALQAQTLKDFTLTTPRPMRRSALLYVGSIDLGPDSNLTPLDSQTTGHYSQQCRERSC